MILNIAVVCRIGAANPRDFVRRIAQSESFSLSVITDSENYEDIQSIDQSRIYHYQPTWPTNVARVRPKDKEKYNTILSQIDPDVVLVMGNSEITFMHPCIETPPTIYLPQGGDVQKAIGKPYWSDSRMLAALNYLTYRPLMWNLLREVEQVWSAKPNRKIFEQLGLPRGRFESFDWGVVDTDLFSPHDNPVEFVEDDETTIIGTFRRIRGHSLLESYRVFLEAVKRLREHRNDFHVVIGGYYGDGRTNETVKLIDEMIAKYDMEDWISQLEMVPKTELPRYYSGLDVYFNPTHKEIELTGLGTASKEAMACGCSYVTLDTPPKAYDIQDGVNGFIASHSDPKGLRDIFDKLCSDGEVVNETGQSARQTVVEKYSGEAVTIETLNKCRDVVGQSAQ